MNFYDLKVERPDGSMLSLSEMKGKVVLVVNTATGCGFTPHYAPIEKMYEDLHSFGFEVIDVPCNQFHGQAPGNDSEIHEFCTLHYHTTFPQMKKADVNGANAIELFQYLKKEKGFSGFGKSPAGLAMSLLLRKTDRNYKSNPDIKWNFTKFVIDRNGQVIARFEPTENMKNVRDLIEKLVKEEHH